MPTATPPPLNLDPVRQAILAVTAESLAAGVGEAPADWHAQSLAALDALDASNALDEPDLAGGRLGSHLAALGVEDLGPGVSASPGRGVLLGELALNLARPQRINQGLKGTCAATSVEIYAATVLPGEYVRVVRSLAGTKGEVVLAGGDTMLIDETGPLVWDAREARRSPVSRIFQVAAMEYALQGLDYCNTRDTHTDAEGVPQGTGLDLRSFDRLVDQVTGENWALWSLKQTEMAREFAEKFGIALTDGPDDPHEMMEIAARCLADGDYAFATIAPVEVDLEALDRALGTDLSEQEGSELPVLPHKVRVLAVDRAAGRVRFDDPMDPTEPWFESDAVTVEDREGTCSMALDTFSSMLIELSARERYWA